jgi:acetylornithine deacetylase
MTLELFRDMLAIDSTSGQEREFALWLREHLEAPRQEQFEVGDGTLNLLFSWGSPRVVFCTHMDTVPPYIAPTFEPDTVRGRGSCDAKGQIFSMYSACRELAAKGCEGFGLLLLSGEETGSFGAKAFSRSGFRAPYLVIGEPTDNCMVSASKGTKSFDFHFSGAACHSGYPEHGRSAVEMFVDMMNILRAEQFGLDPLLGETTYNVGLLHSDNPQNILSPALDCRIYFRTTFASDARVCELMQSFANENISVNARGGDSPAEYLTLPGFRTKAVAFGSDAPHLGGFEHKMICGPGSIMTAHRPDECVRISDLQEAINNYVRIYEDCDQRLR